MSELTGRGAPMLFNYRGQKTKHDSRGYLALFGSPDSSGLKQKAIRFLRKRDIRTARDLAIQLSLLMQWF